MTEMVSGEAFASLLAAAQAGSEWAFNALYDDYNPRLLRYFRARAPRAAEDLVSETWMGAATKLAGFHGEEQAFRSWIFTIAHRRLVDHWRERGDDAWDPGSLPDKADVLGGPEETIVAGATAQAAVQRIAAVLGPEQAEVVLLRILGGLEVEQVAEILGKRPGTIRVLQHRALRRLAEEISLEDVTG